MVLGLEKNRTYIIDGVLITNLEQPSGAIFQQIGFTAPAGATLRITYRDNPGLFFSPVDHLGVIDTSATPAQYQIADGGGRRPIAIVGTIEMGSISGDLVLQWGHHSQAGTATTTVEAGSFLRADQI